MTVREILTIWLKEHGYDGLCTDDCGCGIDDLAPCQGDCLNCNPAYKVPASGEFKEDWGDEQKWMYSTTKSDEGKT